MRPLSVLRRLFYFERLLYSVSIITFKPYSMNSWLDITIYLKTTCPML